jgi:hypothetical protein
VTAAVLLLLLPRLLQKLTRRLLLLPWLLLPRNLHPRSLMLLLSLQLLLLLTGILYGNLLLLRRRL